MLGTEDYVEAIWYLSKLTGIVSRADYSNTLGYRNHSAYTADMAAWRRWLRVNQYGFKVAKADSITSSISTSVNPLKCPVPFVSYCFCWYHEVALCPNLEGDKEGQCRAEQYLNHHPVQKV